MRLKTAVLTALTSLCATGMAAHAGTWVPDTTNSSSWFMGALAFDIEATNIPDGTDDFGFGIGNFGYTYEPDDLEEAPLSEAKQNFGFSSTKVLASVDPGDGAFVHANSSCLNLLSSFYGNPPLRSYSQLTSAYADGAAPFEEKSDPAMDDDFAIEIDPFDGDYVTFNIFQRVYNEVYGFGNNPVHGKAKVLTGSTSEVSLSPQ